MAGKSFVHRVMFGGGILFDLTKWTVAAAVLLTLVHIFWFTIFMVDGISMEPSMQDQDGVLLSRVAFNGDKKINRGDVVVIRYPGDPDNKQYVKRVIALPGERIDIASGKVYVNKEPLKEHYLPSDIQTGPAGTWQLSDKEYFLMGDNRPNSNDSRTFGPVEKRFLVGKAIAIIYPRLTFIGAEHY
ncbi:MAG: Signal peptidase I S [bacterium ADurb.Bin400]|nr:MAG: Signal peptidase I S [bacterium ADurb.Bin400]